MYRTSKEQPFTKRKRGSELAPNTEGSQPDGNNLDEGDGNEDNESDDDDDSSSSDGSETETGGVDAMLASEEESE